MFQKRVATLTTSLVSTSNKLLQATEIQEWMLKYWVLHVFITWPFLYAGFLILRLFCVNIFGFFFLRFYIFWGFRFVIPNLQKSIWTTRSFSLSKTHFLSSLLSLTELKTERHTKMGVRFFYHSSDVRSLPVDALVWVGDVEEEVVLVVLLVEAAHGGRGGRDHVVHEEEQGVLGAEGDPETEER